MDTSETYIKMCEEAREIVREHKWEDGDVSYNLKGGWVCICPACSPAYHASLVWLPRQDQLQEMIASEETEPALIFQDKLAHFCMWVRYQCHKPVTSMEQLWLAFVMSERYKKRWSGTDWIG